MYRSRRKQDNKKLFHIEWCGVINGVEHTKHWRLFYLKDIDLINIEEYCMEQSQSYNEKVDEVHINSITRCN